MKSGTIPSLLIALALLTSSGAADAQTLRGRILDSQSGEPVQLAYVGLLEEGRDMVVAALADTEGVFELDAPEEGSYFVYVSRTGYESLMDGVFELGEGGVVDVQIGRKAKPIELDAVVVETRAGSLNFLERNGFYDRAITGQGSFMIREEIERVAIDRVSDALRQIPRLSIVVDRPLVGSPRVMQSPEIRVWRGGQQCSPTLYVDRHVVASGVGGAVRPDDFVTPVEIDAIEVYTRSVEIPVGFDEINNCGVVLLWTRTR